MLKQISTLDWQKQQQSFDDLTTCGDPARLVSRLNWISYLYTSLIVSTAIYASETSETPRGSGSGRRRGRPTKTWRSTFKEDLVARGVDWNSVRAVATNRSRWRTLAAHCPVKDRRI